VAGIASSSAAVLARHWPLNHRVVGSTTWRILLEGSETKQALWIESVLMEWLEGDATLVPLKEAPLEQDSQQRSAPHLQERFLVLLLPVPSWLPLPAIFVVIPCQHPELASSVETCSRVVSTYLQLDFLLQICASPIDSIYGSLQLSLTIS